MSVAATADALRDELRVAVERAEIRIAQARLAAQRRSDELSTRAREDGSGPPVLGSDEAAWDYPADSWLV
ncbi:hypothetical protein FK531_18585 [Rhodococcus spelaei]|uniref:Uncharacterized protein n=1 Tax=Rhodococcus spelaei TaxID=2546320 RepID=A0A541B0P5_9NOCA|nr:hypothetical protein [Rhodococcus spelaei]TQF65897.1 hypothetical protein FK531_18585 [Rhodococcus spelaei]